jgi:hypothetical protein
MDGSITISPSKGGGVRHRDRIGGDIPVSQTNIIQLYYCPVLAINLSLLSVCLHEQCDVTILSRLTIELAPPGMHA